jgi:proteasome lid subunit RPN8/RPN11
MTIDLRPEQEQVVGQAIQAGLIQAADDLVAIGIETIWQQLEARRALTNALSAEDWSRALHAWIHSHPATAPLLSDEAISRDSIYGARGQ